MDVYSERTAIDEGNAQVDQRQERRRELSRPLDGGGELLGRLQDRRAVRIDLGDIEEAAEDLALLGEDLLQDGIAAVVFDLSHAWHGCSSYLVDDLRCGRHAPEGDGPKDSGKTSARRQRSPPSAGAGATRSATARTDSGACPTAHPGPARLTPSR